MAIDSPEPLTRESLGDPEQPPKPRAGRWRHRALTALFFAVAIVAGLTVVFVGMRALQPHSFAGTAFPDPQPAANLDGLLFDSGEPADIAQFEGDVVLLYFGYTFCPDVCPTTLFTAAEARDRLGEDGDRVHLVMVSVDPERDPLNELGSYVRHFDETFLGAGGADEAIAQAAASYGIYYQLHEPDENGNYTVGHTATLLGINPDGDLKVIWQPTVTAEDLSNDMKELLQ